MVDRVRSFLVAVLFFGYNSFVGMIPAYCIRHGYLRSILRIRLGRRAAIHMNCFITGRNITIGSNTVVNRRCYLDGRGGITIGSNVSISPECYILSLTHDTNAPDFGAVAKLVYIGDRVWIGARAIVLPGVTLGEGCVVGAGSVVTKSVEPYTVVGGNPARVIGERARDLSYTVDYRPWFDTDVL